MPYVESCCTGYIIHGRDHGKEGTLYQVDYDFPHAAESLGWSLRRVQPAKTVAASVAFKLGADVPYRILERAPARGKGCGHGSTDGTVRCRECGIPAGAFIEAASYFLSSKC